MISRQSLGNRKHTFSVRSITDTAAAGPEFFWPVSKLLREWCFLGRYVDVCGILMLVLMLTRRLVYSLAHWVLFVLLKNTSSDYVLHSAWSIQDFREDLCHTAIREDFSRRSSFKQTMAKTKGLSFSEEHIDLFERISDAGSTIK